MNQEKLLAKLSGKKRLQQAFELTDLVFEFARKNIQNLAGSKKLTEKELLQKLRKRLELI